MESPQTVPEDQPETRLRKESVRPGPVPVTLSVPCHDLSMLSVLQDQVQLALLLAVDHLLHPDHVRVLHPLQHRYLLLHVLQTVAEHLF